MINRILRETRLAGVKTGGSELSLEPMKHRSTCRFDSKGQMLIAYSVLELQRFLHDND